MNDVSNDRYGEKQGSSGGNEHRLGLLRILRWVNVILANSKGKEDNKRDKHENINDNHLVLLMRERRKLLLA